MMKIFIGFLIGVSLSFGISAVASGGPEIVGGDGVLSGVEVVDRNGKRVCEDPDWAKASKIISCE